MKQTLIALDQFINTLIPGGFADETISARSWRLRRRPGWGLLRLFIDGLFFWQDEHCKASYLGERMRAHFPPEYRERLRREQRLN